MYAKPRAATVRCVEPGTLWGLDRSGFREAQKTRSKADAVDVTKLPRKGAAAHLRASTSCSSCATG